MRHRGGLAVEVFHARLAQQLLARQVQLRLALAQHARQARDEHRDHHRAGDEVQPHARQVVVHRVVGVVQVQRHVFEQQHRVAGERIHRQRDHLPPGQDGRGDGQPGQVERHEGVGRAAGVEQDRRQRGQVHQQLAHQFGFAGRAVAPPVLAQAQGGDQVEQGLQPEHHHQRPIRQPDAGDRVACQQRQRLPRQQRPAQPEQAAQRHLAMARRTGGRQGRQEGQVRRAGGGGHGCGAGHGASVSMRPEGAGACDTLPHWRRGPAAARLAGFGRRPHALAGLHAAHGAMF
ncbi:hypothetical protein D3C81_930180 [compost metagenome]